MKRLFWATVFCLGALCPQAPVHADFWGADVAVLANILVETIAELAQLKAILQDGKDSLDLVRQINDGINDSLAMAKTMGIRIDPGIYRDLGTVDQALGKVEELYGRAVDSPLATSQRSTDQTVAEAISFNNHLNEYTRTLDQVGEQVKSYSHAVSPGGAAKLTAETLGVVIHVLNQQLRATGQGLKLQAQALAVQNKKEKSQTEQYLKEGDSLKSKMMSLNADFTVPRF